MLSFYSFPNCCTAQIATSIHSLPDEVWKQNVANQLDGFQDFAIITLITTHTQKGAHPFLKEMGFEEVFVGRKSHNKYKQRHQETGDLTLWAGEPAVLKDKSQEWLKNNPFDPYEVYKKSTFPVKNLVRKISEKNIISALNELYKPTDYTNIFDPYRSTKDGLMRVLRGYSPAPHTLTVFGINVNSMIQINKKSMKNDELIAFQERLVKDGHIKGFKDG